MNPVIMFVSARWKTLQPPNTDWINRCTEFRQEPFIKSDFDLKSCAWAGMHNMEVKAAPSSIKRERSYLSYYTTS